MPVLFGGPIGRFPDHVQQRDVDVKVLGSFEYQANQPVDEQMERWLRAQLMNAVKNVITAKMQSGQLTFRHLGTGQIGMVMPEIMQSLGVEQHGFRVGNIEMRFVIDGHEPPQQQPPGQQQLQQQQPQHVVEANIRVAGLNINASSDHGVDTQGLQNQLKDKAKSQVIWWGIGCGILFVVGLGVLGLGFYIWRNVKAGMESSTSASSPRAAAAAKWDGTSTFNCGGTDAVTLTGVKASAGIEAGGNCQLTLVNCDITAPTGIDAIGNAQVTITGGSINGSTAAVKTSGNAQVTMVGTKVAGKKAATGNSKITGP